MIVLGKPPASLRQRDPLPILAQTRYRQEIALAVMALARRHHMAESFPVEGTQALGNDEIERLAESLVGLMAEDPLGPWVPHPDESLRGPSPPRRQQRRPGLHPQPAGSDPCAYPRVSKQPK
jgi:hypothetical protein